MKLLIAGLLIGAGLVSLGWLYTNGYFNNLAQKVGVEYAQFKARTFPPTDVKTYTDTAGLFSFSYPTDWTLSHPVEGGHDSDGINPIGETDYQKNEKEGWKNFSRPVELRVPGKEAELFANVTVRREDSCSLESKKPATDHFHTQTDLNINGTPVLYDYLDFVGPAEAEKYKDHTYTFAKELDGDSICIVFSFRENISNSTIDLKVDNSQYLSSFEYIVSTMKFN